MFFVLLEPHILWLIGPKIQPWVLGGMQVITAELHSGGNVLRGDKSPRSAGSQTEGNHQQAG